MRNCKQFSNVNTLKTLYFSLIRSKIEYGATIWNPIYNVHSESIERIQRKFIKYLAFKVDRHYPEQGYPNNLLLARFNMQSLKVRRMMNILIFLYKLVNYLIDCPILLAKINFRIPRLEVRQRLLFYCPTSRTNVAQKSPIYNGMELYNALSDRCDIFNSSLNNYIKIIKTSFQ